MTPRNQSLDLLRAAAIILVVAYHGAIWPFARSGWIGVDLFFVLSGFLVSNLLYVEYAKTGDVSIGRFLVRRGLKIWPGFYLFFAFGVLLTFRHFPARPYLLLGTFTSNYIREPLPSLFGAIWSLCVEEHFYLALPIMFLFLKPFGPKGFTVVPIVSAAAVVGCTYFRARTPYDPSVFATHVTHLRFDSLLTGVALGYFKNFRPKIFAALSSNCSLIAMILCVPAFILDQASRWMQSYGLTGLYIGFAALIPWAISRTPRTRIGKVVASKIALLGLYSYSIYLWHSVFVVIGPIVPQPFVRAVAYVILSLLVGVLMAKLVEFPVLRLRDRMLPPRAKPLSHCRPAYKAPI